MIYTRHNFKENITNALRYGSDSDVFDVIGSGISSLLNRDRLVLVRILKNSNVKVDDNISDNELVDKIVEQISKGNNKVTGQIIQAILEIDSDFSNDATPILGWISAAVKQIGAIFKGATEVKKSKEEEKQNKLQKQGKAFELAASIKQSKAGEIQMQTLEYQTAERNKRKRIIIGGGALLLIFGFVALGVSKYQRTH